MNAVAEKSIDTNFGGRLVKNLSWSGLSVILRLVLAGGTLAALGRLVEPKVMGVYGVAWSASALGYNICQSGAAQGIIAMKKVDGSHLSAAYVISTIFSVVMAALLVLASPLIEQFYGVEGLSQAFTIGGLFIPLMCLPTVDVALAQKELKFGRLALIQTMALMLASITALGLAIFQYELVSLFALQGSVGLYSFLMFRLYKRSMPLRRFKKIHVVEVWRFGGHLSLNSLTAVAMQNMPQLIMAKYLPIEAIGCYAFSDRIVQIIREQLTGMISTVLYPTLSSIQSDLKRVSRLFLIATYYTVSGISLSLMVFVIVPGPFLHLYGGEQWSYADDILRYVAVYQIIASLGANVFPTFQSIGIPSAQWRWNLFFSSVQGAVIWELSDYGIVTVTKGMAIACALTGPIAVCWLSRTVRFRFRDYLKGMTRAYLSTAFAISAGILATTWTGEMAPLFAFLIPSSAAGLIALGLLYLKDAMLQDQIHKVFLRKRTT